MAGGRPTKYTKELAVEICLAISNSSKGLVPLCKANPKWPSHSTIRKWIFENKEFSDNYEKAKQEQADFLADEMLEIADDNSNDLLEGQHGNVPNGANVQRSRLKIDTRKWIASKLKPKKYGDKLDLTSDGNSITPMIIDWNGGNKDITNTKTD